MRTPTRRAASRIVVPIGTFTTAPSMLTGISPPIIFDTSPITAIGRTVWLDGAREVSIPALTSPLIAHLESEATARPDP
jgi:hypothetical protein